MQGKSRGHANISDKKKSNKLQSDSPKIRTEPVQSIRKKILFCVSGFSYMVKDYGGECLILSHL